MITELEVAKRLGKYSDTSSAQTVFGRFTQLNDERLTATRASNLDLLPKLYTTYRVYLSTESYTSNGQYTNHYPVPQSFSYSGGENLERSSTICNCHWSTEYTASHDGNHYTDYEVNRWIVNPSELNGMKIKKIWIHFQYELYNVSWDPPVEYKFYIGQGTSPSTWYLIASTGTTGNAGYRIMDGYIYNTNVIDKITVPFTIKLTVTVHPVPYTWETSFHYSDHSYFDFELSWD